MSNTQLIIDDSGEIRSIYHKTHLYALENPLDLNENDFVEAGNEIVEPVDTPIGRIGLSICFDLRFPSFYRSLALRGAQILTVPSAFLHQTGEPHWEVLLRARAIENQCYVIAAAQVGRHSPTRKSYGHSMVIDPWGKVIANMYEETGVCVAEIDLDYLDEVKGYQNIMRLARSDLYTEV